MNMTLEEFRNVWAFRKFKCGITGDTLVIPEDVKFKDFFSFGESYVDVGDGYYCRYGGKPIDVTED